MKKTRKDFKDFEISDFIDMGSLQKTRESTPHWPFFGFNKKKKGETSISYTDYPVSDLDEVL